MNGEADINTSWLAELKENPVCPHRVKRDSPGASFPKMQVLPRFLVEGWDLEGYQALFAPKSAVAKRFVELLVSTVRKHSFDGLVLDAGYLNARAPWRDQLMEVMRSLGDALHKENKLFVLVIPVRPFSSLLSPHFNSQLLESVELMNGIAYFLVNSHWWRSQAYRGGKIEDTYFNNADFTELHQHVDYFSLMTYDFSNGEKPGPSSPMEWFAGSHAVLVTEEQRDQGLARQILGGINLYGNDFADAGGGGPIIADGILALLKQKKPKIQWDDKFQEHYFEYKANGVPHRVWFPTLMYLQNRMEMAQEKIGSGLSFWELGQGMDYFYDLL